MEKALKIALVPTWLQEFEKEAVVSKQQEIRKAIKTCIAIEQSGGEFDGNRLTQKILEVEDILGVVIKVERELPERLRQFIGVLDAEGEVRKAGYEATESLVKE